MIYSHDIFISDEEIKDMLNILYRSMEWLNGERGTARLIPYNIAQRIKVWLLINVN
jgi:hypothetical protein